MKIIVMQTRDGNAAVLDEQGIFHTIEDKNYIVGQKLDMAETELYAANSVKHSGAGSVGASGKNIVAGRFCITGVSKVAAAVLACVLVGGGVTAYAAPVSTVTISQDYTVEYKLNLFDRVIRVEAYAPEGTELPDELRAELTQGVKGKNIADAIDMTMETMEKLEMAEESSQGEVSQGEFRLEITGPGAKEELSEKLEQKVDDWNEERRAIPDQDVDGDGDLDDSDNTSGEKPSQPQTLPGTENGDRPDGQQDGAGQKPEQKPGQRPDGEPNGAIGGNEGDRPDGNLTGNPNGDPNGNPNGDPNGNPAGETGANENSGGSPSDGQGGMPNGDFEGNPNDGQGGMPNGDFEGNPNDGQGGTPNGELNGNPDGSAMGDPNGGFDREAVPNEHPGGDSNGGSNGNPGGNAAPPPF